MTAGRKKTGHVFWRITISLIGVALLLLAVRDLTLFFWGESTVAQIDVRRTGGAQDGAGADWSYRWSISYSFTAKGRTYQGHSSRRGSAIGVKVEPKVYYFSFLPQLNSLADSARPGLGQLVLAGSGVFLLLFMNKATVLRKKDDIDKEAQPPRTCSSCGQQLAAADRYCAACGSKYTEVT